MTHLSVNPRTNQLVDTVGRLWPGHEVSLVRERLSSSNDPRLLIVPNRSSPRLLVPAGDRAAAASAVRRFSRALSTRERVARVIGGTALRLAAAPLFPDRLQLVPTGGGQPSIEDRLSDILGVPVRVGLGVGSLRANQKPILQVFNGKGRCLAYVKVGHSDRTAELVHREAKALLLLEQRTWRRLEIPRLLHIGDWRDMTLLVITALDTAVRAGSGSILQPPIAALDELYDNFDQGSAQLGQSAYWHQLVSQVPDITDNTQREAFASALTRIEDCRGQSPVRLTAWHGDFAPWNLSWRGSRLQLWDWEQFATDVPRGLDRVHYVVHTSTRAQGFTKDVINSALATEFVRHPGTTQAEQSLLNALYVASLAARYLRFSRGRDGEVLAPAAATALQVLTDHSNRLTEETNRDSE